MAYYLLMLREYKAKRLLTKERGEPGSPLEKELLDDGNFATVAKPGLTVAGCIDGDTEYNVVACG